MRGPAGGPSGHTYLDFNAPLSDARAAGLVSGLGPLAGARVVDLGCGWAELLLRLLAGEPTATGLGIDVDADAIARGRANARARGLGDRARLEEGEVTAWEGAPADVVIAIGVSHAWGGTRPMLEWIRPRLGPRGRLLVGEGIWERAPTEAALTALGARTDEFAPLPELVDLAIACGYRPLAVAVASQDEWDAFESRWCAGRERWLLEHPGAADADEVRAAVDAHRDGWLHGYRGVLGFAYLTLVPSPSAAGGARRVSRTRYGPPRD